MKKLLIYIVLFTFSWTSSKAFDNPKLGFFGNLNYNLYSTDFTNLPEIPNCCPQFSTGYGYGSYFGGLLQFDLFQKSSFIFKLGLNDKSALLSNIEKETLNFDGTAVDGEFEHRLDFSIKYLQSEFLFKTKFDEFNIVPAIGFAVGYNVSGSVDQVEEIVKPDDRGVFVDSGKRTRNKYTGTIPDLRNLSLAFVSEIAFDLPLNSDGSSVLSPYIGVDISLIAPIPDYDWLIVSGRLGMQVIFDLFDNDKENNSTIPIIENSKHELTRDETATKVTIDNIKPIFTLTDINGNDIDTLLIEEFLSTNMKPLLNYIFFDYNSNILNSADEHYKINDNNISVDFDLKQLANLTTLETYYHILNIIGLRMKINPQAEIHLVGCNSDLGDEGGNIELSRSRAETIKSYLVDKWGIEQNRIYVSAQNLPVEHSNNDTQDGIEENRRVEIQSDFKDILDPVITNDTIVRIDKSKLRLSLKNSPPDYYNNIKVIIEQGDHILLEQEYLPNSNVDFDIDNIDIDNLSSEQADIFVVATKDSNEYKSLAGSIFIDFKSIARKQVERIDDKRVDKFSLILFKFNQFRLDERNKRITELIKESIQDNSTVEINGYTDRMGSTDYNIQLSERRAAEVAKQLGLNRTNARGFGEGVVLYTNDEPEGRFYNRTVEVIIETPILWK